MKNYLIFGSFLCVLLILLIGWRRAHGAPTPDNTSGGDNPIPTPASDLKQTVIVATPEAPIEPGTNVLWCGTFQLAWNGACGLIGEDIHFVHDPPMVAELNKKTFTSADVDSASYVALAGFVKDGIHKKIRDALAQKFGNSAKPVLMPEESLTPFPNDIVVYTYLFKNLEFAVPFERLNAPLKFGDHEVPAFGMTEAGTGHGKMASQAILLDQKAYDDFVIELKTKSPQDHLILAKIKPGKTLNETIQLVEDRIRSGRAEQLGSEDVLAVPQFNFDVTRAYSEIEGIHFKVQNANVSPSTYVVSAKQNIRFQMDEKGVRLKSEAQFLATLGIHRRFVFDKPFLVMLKRTNRKVPYFAMWVDNPELLAKN